MTKLMIHTEEEPREEILRPGVNSLGRNPENQVTIPHPSVSGSHAELVVGSEGLQVRDLGSTNGTYVDDEPVRESVVRPGQRIRFGEISCEWAPEISPSESPPSKGPVRLQIKKAAPEAVPVAPPASGAESGAPLPSETSAPGPAEGPAELFCVHCEKAVYKHQARKQQVGRDIHFFCPTCNSRCETIEKFSAKRTPLEKETFGKALMASFRYPLRSDGLLMLGIGAIFFTVLHGARYVSSFAGLFGLVAVMILTIFITGYLFSFLKSVLLITAHGEDKIPDWPEFTSMGEDIVEPFLQFAGLVVFSFGPAIAWMLFGPEAGKVLGGIALVFFGLLYFPMALLAVVIFDTLFALNPLLIVTSMMKIFGHYLVMLIFIGAVLLLRYLGLLAGEHIPLPILPSLISELFTLYFFMVIMRAMGQMYRIDKQKLGWLRR